MDAAAGAGFSCPLTVKGGPALVFTISGQDWDRVVSASGTGVGAGAVIGTAFTFFVTSTSAMGGANKDCRPAGTPRPRLRARVKVESRLSSVRKKFVEPSALRPGSVLMSRMPSLRPPMRMLRLAREKARRPAGSRFTSLDLEKSAPRLALRAT